MANQLFTILILVLLIPALARAEGVPATGGWLVVDKALLEKFFPASREGRGHLADSLSEAAADIATEHGLSPQLVKSIIRAESNGDPKAFSPKGAMGLMQLMPGTAREYRVSDPFDPLGNIRGGVRYLRNLLREFSGDLSLALAAYNAGPGAVRKYQGIPPYPETREFVRKVRDGYQSGEDLTRAPVFPRREREVPSRERIPGKIYIQGSPRDLAVFLNKMRWGNLEAPVQ